MRRMLLMVVFSHLIYWSRKILSAVGAQCGIMTWFCSTKVNKQRRRIILHRSISNGRGISCKTRCLFEWAPHWLLGSWWINLHLWDNSKGEKKRERIYMCGNILEWNFTFSMSVFVHFYLPGSNSHSQNPRNTGFMMLFV